ncbi:MAG TPA: hypothetical protein VHW23_10245 [Kofleriaceae bacterium]|nr:hypothetical protein [Kofleriaceae bacterium]
MSGSPRVTRCPAPPTGTRARRGDVLALLCTLEAGGRSLEDTLRVVAGGMARCPCSRA